MTGRFRHPPDCAFLMSDLPVRRGKRTLQAAFGEKGRTMIGSHGDGEVGDGAFATTEPGAGSRRGAGGQISERRKPRIGVEDEDRNVHDDEPSAAQKVKDDFAAAESLETPDTEHDALKANEKKSV